MESPSQKIIIMIEEIILLLSNCPVYQPYSNFFLNILNKLNKPHDLSKISQEILSIYGGMCTFGDVVLYKDGKVTIKEMDRFDALREKLFTACESARDNQGLIRDTSSMLSKIVNRIKEFGKLDQN